MARSFEERMALFPPSAMTNRELWHWRAGSTPDRRWLTFGGQTWNYGEFDVEVRRLAAGLRELGIGPEVRVLAGMTNRMEAVQLHLALSELGAVCVPLLPGLPFDEMAHPIQHSEATVVVADDPIASLVLENRDNCGSVDRVIVVGDVDIPAGANVDRFEDLAASSPLTHERLESQDDQSLAYIIYTSGSTGRPKGVLLKAGSFYACALGYADCYGFDSEDTYFLPLTLGHSLGANAGVGIPIVTGGALGLVERFRPSMFWKQIEETGGTISVLFPAHLNLILEVDDGTPAKGESSLRFVVSHADISPFRERFGVEIGTIWGMTETLICAGSDGGYRGELGPGFVGRPFPGGELGVFDEDFNRLGPGRYGELCMRHPQAMIGYLKDPEATAATLVDGWVRSGDRGIIDFSGRAYFAGRYKAMIKRSGENVSSEEVEAALEQHPAVAECVVFAVPDRLRTEEVGVVVVQRSGSGLDPAELRDFAAEKLVRWKLPRYIALQDDPLARLGNGKLDRVAIAASMDVEAAWDAEAVAKT